MVTVKTHDPIMHYQSGNDKNSMVTGVWRMVLPTATEEAQ